MVNTLYLKEQRIAYAGRTLTEDALIYLFILRYNLIRPHSREREDSVLGSDRRQDQIRRV